MISEKFHIPAPLSPVVEKLAAGERISFAEGELLWREAPVALLGTLAVGAKRRKSGEAVYYNRNIHIEPTNICLFDCRFCSYRRPADSPEAWNLSLNDIARIARGQAGEPITEVHIVGGVHPDHDLQYYAEMIRTVKRELPHVAVKAYTAVELARMIDKAGLGDSEGLALLKEAGMDAIPGGGAEIFDEGLRSQICPEKGSAERWLAVHRAAHGLGLPTNATILYGHAESVAHRIDHLDRLRRLQDETGGFDAFIPLKYRSHGNRMSDYGEVGVVEDMRMMAFSRLYLDNFPHIKAYWPMLGRTATEMALAYGADDVDGTIDDTTKIYSMAGAEDQRPAMSVAQLQAMAAAAGFTAVERDTFYNPVEK